MRIRKLKIQNFMRIKDATLSFDGKGVIGIRAEHVDDPDRSNYLGKTTITEAILYNLFGKSRTKKETALIHHGEELMSVTSWWEQDDGTIVKIRRGRDIKNNGVLEANFASKTGQSQDEINKALGVGVDDFEQIFYFKQQDIHAFMSRTADDKKKQLMGWLKNDHWQDKEVAAQALVKTKKAEINKLQITIKNAELEVGEEQAVQDEYGLAKSRLSVKRVLLEDVEREMRTLTSGQNITPSAVATAQSKLDKLDRQRNELEEKLERRQLKLDEYKKLKAETDKWGEVQAELDTVNRSIEKLSKDETRFSMKVESLETVQKELENAKGVCPISGKGCDLIVPSDKEHTERLNQIVSLQNTLEKTRNHLGDQEHLRDILKERLRSIDKLESLKNSIKAMDGVKDQMTLILTQIEEQKKIVDSYDPEIQEKLDTLNFRHSEISDEVHDLTKTLGGLEEKIKRISENRELLDATRQQILALNTELGDLQYVSFMFGRNGIPSLEIENSFQDIEDDVNYVLTQINDKVRIEMQPTRELSTWEDSCPACGFVYPKGYRKKECESCGCQRNKKKKDELRLVVIENGYEQDFEICSGGLKTIISLCVRIALALLVKRQTSTTVKTLFLDEIDSALDNAHKEQLKAIVTTVLKQQYGFEQIFWISHDKSISNSVPDTILVKGYDTYSELEWL